MSTTTQIRDEVFAEQAPSLRIMQGLIYGHLLQFGPCTTRQLAERCGISIFTVRPRVCELVDLGMAALCGKEGREGVYRSITFAETQKMLADEAAQQGQATQGELL